MTHPDEECADALKRAIYQAQYALHCGRTAGHTAQWQATLADAIERAKNALWHIRQTAD